MSWDREKILNWITKIVVNFFSWAVIIATVLGIGFLIQRIVEMSKDPSAIVETVAPPSSKNCNLTVNFSHVPTSRMSAIELRLYTESLKHKVKEQKKKANACWEFIAHLRHKVFKNH